MRSTEQSVGISSGDSWVSVTGTRRYQVGVSHHIREANMIEVSNLTKKYGDHIAVDHLSFRVERDRFTAFLVQTAQVNPRP